jgi:hypothetical protein
MSRPLESQGTTALLSSVWPGLLRVDAHTDRAHTCAGPEQVDLGGPRRDYGDAAGVT